MVDLSIAMLVITRPGTINSVWCSCWLDILQGAAMGLDPSQLADFENLSPEELQKEADQTWLAMASWAIPEVNGGLNVA